MSGQSLTMQSKSQVYSNIVFPQIQSLINQHQADESIKRYKSLCKRSGGLLRSVGLIQWLSFLAAKAARGEVHHQYLLDNLVTELTAINKTIKVKTSEELLLTVRKQNLPEYMYTTTQVLKLLQWHKRIADILITSGETQ
jgi:CRISPR type III-B/RAMP module-associated protein Cmr5